MSRELTPAERHLAELACDLKHPPSDRQFIRTGGCPSCRSAILALVDGDREQVPEDDLCEDCLEQKATEFFETVPNQRCKDCTIKMLEEVCERMRADMPVAPDDPAAVGCVAMILRDYANEKDVERAARIVKVFAAPSGQGVGEAVRVEASEIALVEDAIVLRSPNAVAVAKAWQHIINALNALATPPAAPQDTRDAARELLALSGRYAAWVREQTGDECETDGEGRHTMCHCKEMSFAGEMADIAIRLDPSLDAALPSNPSDQRPSGEEKHE